MRWPIHVRFFLPIRSVPMRRSEAIAHPNELLRTEKGNMRLGTLGLSAVFTLLGALTIPASAQEGGSNLIPFDPPGAGTGPYQGTGCFGCTFGINQSGAIAGTYLDANNVFHGFLRHPWGGFVTFESPGADTTPNSYNGTFAQNINDDGSIAGFYADVQGVPHGFLRSPEGAFTTFDVPGAVNGTWPIFLNHESDVVGFSLDANLLFHAFLRRRDGTFATFVGPGSCDSGTPAGCYGSAATYIDNSGRIVGSFMDNSGNFVGRGLVRSPDGKLTTFDAPGAGTGPGQGTGCPGCNLEGNRWGAIAGTYSDANNAFHGFLRGPEGKFITFDATGAGTGSYQGTGCSSDCPVTLNDKGEIAGSYSDSNYVQHGFLRYPSGAFVTLDPPGSTWTQPESMNNSGAIVGYYMDAGNVLHGFLRTQE
jgi:hypothetical protein